MRSKRWRSGGRLNPAALAHIPVLMAITQRRALVVAGVDALHILGGRLRSILQLKCCIEIETGSGRIAGCIGTYGQSMEKKLVRYFYSIQTVNLMNALFADTTASRQNQLRPETEAKHICPLRLQTVLPELFQAVRQDIGDAIELTE